MTAAADDELDRFVSGRALWVPWQKVESELGQLWKRAAERDRARVLVRACLWNVLALVPTEPEGLERYRALMDRVSAEVPSRVIGLCERSEQTELAAFVEANWRGHGAVVNGSDEVLLIGAPLLRRSLESLATSLLVPDAAIALYVDGRPELPRLEYMLAHVGRLIVDSRRIDSGRELGDYARLVLSRPQLELADLGWLGISPMRSTLASLFDRKEEIAALEGLDTIEVTTGVSGFATRAVLYLGWLGSRLGLGPPERLADDGDGVSFRAVRGEQAVRLRLNRREQGGHGVVAVQLSAADSTWRIERDQRGLAISAPGVPARVQPARRHEDADLVIAALGSRGADPVYRNALEWGVRLGELL